MGGDGCDCSRTPAADAAKSQGRPTSSGGDSRRLQSLAAPATAAVCGAGWSWLASVWRAASFAWCSFALLLEDLSHGNGCERMRLACHAVVKQYSLSIMDSASTDIPLLRRVPDYMEVAQLRHSCGTVAARILWGFQRLNGTTLKRMI